MKALTEEEPRTRSRRVSKPVMEKRRRERINHSLETLRLLMLENTHDERLKNPKVEKAEILESVVQFLKTDRDAQRPSRAPTHDGVRSCLLRIRDFISSEAPEPEGPGAGGEPRPRAPSPGHTPGETPLYPQHLPRHPYLPRDPGLHGDTRRLLAASTHGAEPVWRPWPQ